MKRKLKKNLILNFAQNLASDFIENLLLCNCFFSNFLSAKLHENQIFLNFDKNGGVW